MRIDELTVTNFDGFDHRKFTLNPAFNLLVGDNAAGKTSVLDALAVSIGSWFLGLRGVEKSPGIAPEEVRVVPYGHQDRFTFEKQFPATISCSGVVMEQRICWSRELQREGSRTTRLKAKSISEIAGEAERQ